MSARVRGVFAAAAAGLLQGCASHMLSVSNPNPYGDYQKVTSNAFVWGSIVKPVQADKCATNLLNDVRVVTSLGQGLATVLTAGFWMPSTTYYKCAKVPVPTASTDN
jgi:hypothetical protein